MDPKMITAPQAMDSENAAALPYLVADETPPSSSTSLSHHPKLMTHLSYQQQGSSVASIGGGDMMDSPADINPAAFRYRGHFHSNKKHQHYLWNKIAAAIAVGLLLLGAPIFMSHLQKQQQQEPQHSFQKQKDGNINGDNTDTNGNAIQATTSKDTTESSNDTPITIEDLRNASVLTGLKLGAVAADHPVCSDVGLQILRDLQGNAIDAAVAVALCLGVANPASSGLGGGAFLLIHVAKPGKEDPNEKDAFIDARTPSRDQTAAGTISGKHTEVIDCREVAPRAAFTDMYKGLPVHASDRGGLAIGVPGELKGLELAHKRHGRLTWQQVVQPAIALAESGVAVNANLAHEIGILAKRYAQFPNQQFASLATLRSIITHHDDWHTPLVEGDLLRNPALADTLRAIRDAGSKALYQGPRAEAWAKDIQQAGGIVTVDDIQNYKATLRTPVVAHDIYGFSVVGVPPPSSGGAAIVGAARFLSDYTTPFASFPETLSVHRMVEAMKHVFAVRMSLSDPNFNNATVADAVRDLTEGSYMGDLANMTHDDSVLSMSQYGGPKWAQLKDTDGQIKVEDADEGDRRQRRLGRGRNLARRFGYLNDGGTSHFSIVDKDGNSISMTTSINTYFGSNVMSPSTGILLSNTMDDFATPGRANYFGLHPSEANYIMPGKKPLSSMSPTMVFRRNETAPPNTLGKLMLVLGASGGPKILSAVFQVMANVILRGMPLYDAMVHPRVHDQLIYHGAAVTTTENTILEQGPGISVSERTRQALTKRGHVLLDVTYEGTVQAVHVDHETGELTAACDVRKGGSPAGY